MPHRIGVVSDTHNNLANVRDGRLEGGVEQDALNAAAARHGFVLAEPPLALDWHGRRIVVVHDPRDFRLAGEHLALHGHTHMFRCEWDAETLVFNPGECAGHMKGYNAVGVVDLDTMEASRLKF